MFDSPDLPSGTASCVQQFAEDSYRDENENDRMELEEKEKKQHCPDQDKGCGKNDPKGKVSGVITLGWRDSLRAAVRTYCIFPHFLPDLVPPGCSLGDYRDSEK